ncbi:MAG: hypothetical protein MUE85_23635 [Microscillaceae bacterium]|jgi:hypothetical protein|nr:hypothetical protein [Microscillaceae bacterium]
MKKVLFQCLMLWTLPLAAQEDSIQWATKVLEVSSEFTNERNPTSQAFRAIQALGEPSTMPSNQENGAAWAPQKQDAGQEYIKVGFAKAMKINQVLINEAANGGAITKVEVYNTTNRVILVYDAELQPLNKGGFINIILKQTLEDIIAVKITLNTQKIAGTNQIDAIGIAYLKEKYLPKINLIADLQIDRKPENLGTKVNSKYQEIAPVVNPEGTKLYFTRSRHPQNTLNPDKQDIWWVDILNDSIISSAKNLGSPINTAQHNSCFPINSTKKLLLNNIYNSDGTLEKGLSTSELDMKGKWSKPKQVVIKDYYNLNTYSEFFMSGDEKYLLMTVERRDTYGGKDIYVAFKQKNGSYSQPQNIGKTVNTGASETSPFLYADNRTLFFSSMGHRGYGSNDIFVSYRLDDTWTNWSEPQNLGPWINTPEWDAYISMPNSGKYIYFASYKDSLGDADIFRAKLSEENRGILFQQK